MQKYYTMNSRFIMNHRVSGLLLSFCIMPFAFCLQGCADTDPDEPGIEKPVVTGVITGDINSRREYTDAVEAANQRNNARGAAGDWNYAKPAVGPSE